MSAVPGVSSSVATVFQHRWWSGLYDPITLRYTRIVSDVTRILEHAQAGDPTAAEQLLPLVYDELRRLAAKKMAHESPGQTLQPTALVHEAWLRLGGDAQTHWESRAHFLGAAGEAMRRILVDRARRKKSAKHGGGLDHIEITA